MSQFFVDNQGLSPGGDVLSTSAEGGATFPPDAAGNVDFSGTGTGAITFSQVANGLMLAAVNVDNATIIVNGSDQLEAINQGISWEIITTDTNAVRGHGYMCDNAITQLVITLPATPAIGDTVTVVDLSGGTFTVGGDGNSSIQIGDLATTLGGVIESQYFGDAVTLVSRGIVLGRYPWIVTPAPSGNFLIPLP